MKKLSPSQHGSLDYITVIIFALIPFIFPLGATGKAISWILAIVHLIMTLFTDFLPGFGKAIPFTIHGYVELFVGLILAIVPWFVGFLNKPSFIFFFIMGLIILLVWAFTKYRSALQR